MIFRNSKFILLSYSLILLIVIGIVIFALYNIKNKNQEASQLQSDADETALARQISRSIRLAQNNSSQDLADFDKLLLTSGKLVSLIDNIEKSGRALGLETNIVSVGKAEEKDSGQSNIVSIAIETKGAWAPTLSFLRAIESLPYRVMISRSDLSKVDNEWHLKIALSLHLFD